MAVFDSKNAKFQITDNGATLRDISAYVIGVRGLPGAREVYDVTALGDGGRKWLPGLENVVITLDLMYSSTALVGADTVLGPLRTDTTARAFDYGPEGTATGKIKYSGSCFVRSYEALSRIGDVVRAVAELVVDGQVTRGTYA